MSFDLKILNGDLAIGSNSDLDTVQDTDKLIQDILKMLLTPVGSNLFFPWYGSLLSASVIGSPLDQEFIYNTARSQIEDSLRILQNLQKQQATWQKVTSSELLAAIKEVYVERNVVDPTYYLVTVSVLTKNLKTTYVNFDITL